MRTQRIALMAAVLLVPAVALAELPYLDLYSHAYCETHTDADIRVGVGSTASIGEGYHPFTCPIRISRSRDGTTIREVRTYVHVGGEDPATGRVCAASHSGGYLEGVACSPILYTSGAGDRELVHRDLWLIHSWLGSRWPLEPLTLHVSLPPTKGAQLQDISQLFSYVVTGEDADDQ